MASWTKDPVLPLLWPRLNPWPWNFRMRRGPPKISTAFNRHPLPHTAWNPLHTIMLHGIYLIQLGSIGPCCIKSTAFNHAAWNLLHSIMLQIIHCIPSGSFTPCCMESTAFHRHPLHHTAWNPRHSIMLHGIHCIQSCFISTTAFNREHWAMLHGINCKQSRGMESTAFNRGDLGHAALNSLHSIGMPWASLHGIHCIQSGSIAP